MARSITSTDANGATFETVGSTSAFSAGDLIYYGTTGYGKIPASSLPSTATSTLTKAYPSLPTNGTSNGYFAPTNFAGLGFNKAVVLLSNGNAVAAYGNPVDGYPYFVIFNPTTRAIVAGPTVISTTFITSAATSTDARNIGVLLLNSGNFVVYWANSAGGTASRVNYAQYTNTGTLVGAVTQDTTLAVNNVNAGCMRGVGLANGGFVLAYGNNTTDVSFRAYDAAGVGQFAWVTLTAFSNGAASGQNPSWGLAARSDNTYLLTGQSTTAGTYNYTIYNYAGTAVVAPATFLVTGGTGNGVTDCATLSDGTTFVIAYGGQTASGTNGWSFRFLPTGNVLGSAFTIQGNFNTTTNNASTAYVRVWPLSSNRFLITGADATVMGAYAVFNSSGTPLLGTTGSIGTASNTRSFGSFYSVSCQVLGVIETGGNAEVYVVPRVTVNSSSSNFFRISLTTYDMVSTTTASGALSIPVATTQSSGYAGTNSTPSKASFALSNGVYPYAPKLSTGAAATAAGVYPTPVSVVNSVNAFDMCVLSNGNICVVLTQGTSPFAYIYNPITLALISSANITTQGSVNPGTDQQTPYIRVTPLSGGSFCVASSSTATTLRLVAYTSAFVQQGSTVNITTFSQTFGSQPANFALCTISGDRVVVVYQTSGTNLNYAVYSSTLAAVVAGTTAATDTSAVYGNAVCATPNGFMVSTSRTTAASYNFYTFFEYSANLFTQPSFATASVFAANLNAPTFTVSNYNGVVYSLVRNSATNASAYSMTGTSTSQVVSASSTAIGVNTMGGGITAAGTPYVIFQDTTNLTTGVQSPNMTTVASLTGWTAPTSRTSNQTAQIRSIPLYGNMVLVAYLIDTSTALVFGTLQINGSPDSAIFTTADATAGIPVYPLATTTVSPAVTNTTFAGVAVTDCAAGGTGVIQTTGTTNLNSTYPTTTAQTFDYTGQAAPGLKGTISGRSISMRKS
jgi:hypothetical protein